MFSNLIKTTTDRLFVRSLSDDKEFCATLTRQFQGNEQFHFEAIDKHFADLEKRWASIATCSLLIIDLAPDSETQLDALERFVGLSPTVPPIIVVSESIESPNARRLLKLRISDWLPKSGGEGEIIQFCKQAVIQSTHGREAQAECYAFLPAIGGAGASTLCIAMASILSPAKNNASMSQSCIVDLNIQNGTIADYLDLSPNLQVEELSEAPERLDAHLLEVMLSRRSNGLAVLAAQQNLLPTAGVDQLILGRLLDITASQFDRVVIDMPRVCQPWAASILQGADKFFIVTELTVSGLSHAKRLTDLIESQFSLDTSQSVIVSKSGRWLRCNVGRSHAKQALGNRLAGFISDCPRLTRDAQNRGLLLREVSRSNSIERDLRKIVQSLGNVSKATAGTKDHKSKV